MRISLGVSELTRRLDYTATAPDTYTVSIRSGAQDVMKMKRPDLPFFVAQLPMVQAWAELRDERVPEILAQIDNQFAFIAAVTGLNVSRKRWTMEWLTIAVQFTIAVETMFKHAFACYRPLELSPQIQPIITTPGHSAYPMGHGAQAFATIVALRGLLKIAPNHVTYGQLYLQARRISVNRVVAGVHFPIDGAAGQALGLSLGELFVAASGLPNVDCFDRTFVPTGLGDAVPNNYLGDGPVDPPGCTTGAAALNVVKSPLLEEMAKRAQAEWSL